jgi:hypothetical protein
MSKVHIDSAVAACIVSRGFGLIAVCLLTCVACTSVPEAPACANYDGAPLAIRARVLGAEQLDASFAVLDCVSRAGTRDDFDEACLVRADPKRKPEMGVEWERELITFTPAVVAELAATHSITLATVFTKDPAGYMLFADDDLSESIMYRRFDRCAP